MSHVGAAPWLCKPHTSQPTDYNLVRRSLQQVNACMVHTPDS